MGITKREGEFYDLQAPVFFCPPERALKTIFDLRFQLRYKEGS